MRKGRPYFPVQIMLLISWASNVKSFAGSKIIANRGLKKYNTVRCVHLFSTASSESADAGKKAKYDELMGATKLSLAPMMEYTDRHFRHLVRLVSSKTLLYTEMVAANALSHERRAQEEEYLSLNPDASSEQVGENYSDQYLRRFLSQGKVQPLEGASVLQLGGSDPKQLFEAAETVMDLTERGWCDYTAINLNCGCPSPKVAGKGCFGAALVSVLYGRSL